MSINNQKIHQAGRFRLLEQLAGNGSILPGMLLIANGTAQTVVPHSVAAGVAEKMFASEDSLQGNTVSTLYASGQPVRCLLEEHGSIVQALLRAGFNYPPGTIVISNGDGTLKPTTGTPAGSIAVVVDGINLSASAAVNTLASVRVL